jgi:hypothetical protein
MLIDDKLLEKENLNKLKIAGDFILDNKNVIRSDNKFNLIKLTQVLLNSK